MRAVLATRGGKGPYRIADRLDFDAIRSDPKFLVGFSDITALHLTLDRHCGLAGVHGAISSDADGHFSDENLVSFRWALIASDPIVVAAREHELTFELTTSGGATGRLIGGDLDMIAICAGWALPDLKERVQDQSQVVPGCHQQRIDGITRSSKQLITFKPPVLFHVPDHRLNRGAASQLSFDRRREAPALAGGWRSPNPVQHCLTPFS